MRFYQVGRIAFAMALATAMWPTASFGQGATTGSIRGRIVSSTGEPVANAQVVVTNEATGFSRNTLANEQGRFAASLLPPGSYRVRAQRIGFRPFEATNVRIRLNEAVTVDIQMTAAATQLEAVTVSADRALDVDTRQTGVADYVSEEEIQTLPTLGRDFTDFIALSGMVSPQPEVSTGGTVAIGGGRTSGVNVQIDGADANFNFFGESRGGARIPFTFSLESIREFQVVTNGYDVEFGNYSSGVVNVVTKGGTNEFQGTGLTYFRSEQLTNKNFETEEGGVTVGGERPRDFQVQQFALNFSGPILKDKLHFLVSYDGQRRRDPFEAGTPAGTSVPRDSVERIISILEGPAYGLSGVAEDFGRFNKTDDVHAVFGRLDWTINEQNRASLRANYANYAAENDGLQFGGSRARSFASTFHDRNLSLVGELNTVFTPTTFNVFRVQLANEERPRVSNNFLPLATIRAIPGQNIEYGGSGITFANDLRETKLQIINNLTHTRGNHTFKVGTNNLFSEVYNKFWLLGAGQYFFDSIDSLNNRVASRYFRLVPESGPKAPETTFGIKEFSVFAQDDWQVTDRLIATVGLRYDITAYGDDFRRVDAVNALPNLGSERIGQGGFRTGNSPSDNDNVSPRVSLAYDIFGDKNHVVRTGVGYFFGRVPSVLGSNVGTGADPYLAVDCRGLDVPDPNYGTFAPDGSTNPDRCKSGANPTGDKEYTFWGNDFEFPETLKANLSYEGRLFEQTRLGVDFIFGRTRKNFTSVDLALRDTPVYFATGEGDRPVFATLGYSIANGAQVARRSQYAGISRIYVNDNQGLADEFAANFSVDQRVGRVLLRGSYTFNWAKDNASFTCCTSGASLFNDPTAGDLNDKGGRDTPNWSNTSYVRPHTFILSSVVPLPYDFEVSGIFRANSGTYFSPTVRGDLNGDGNRDNDLPFIGTVGGGADSLVFTNVTERAQYEAILDKHECLRDAVGSIIQRNTCTNPWFAQLDMGLRKSFALPGARKIELVADFFNVLNGLNPKWGQLRRVGNTQLLQTAAYNAVLGKYVYSVNETFGRKVFIGPVRQFQTQLGARVSF